MSKIVSKNDKIDGSGQVGMGLLLLLPQGVLCDLVFCRELLASAAPCGLFCMFHLPRTGDFVVFERFFSTTWSSGTEKPRSARTTNLASFIKNEALTCVNA